MRSLMFTLAATAALATAPPAVAADYEKAVERTGRALSVCMDQRIARDRNGFAYAMNMGADPLVLLLTSCADMHTLYLYWCQQTGESQVTCYDRTFVLAATVMIKAGY